MARRTWSQLTELYPDNTAGAISAADLRDGVIDSMRPHAAASDPTAANDASQGFDVGHEWRNTSTGAWFKCHSASVGAAVWEKTWPTPSTGDMRKAVYDGNDDGTVDSADVAGRVEETVTTNTNSTATHVIDCNAGTVHLITLTANCTLSFGNVPPQGFGITLELIQDAVGSRAVTWPASVTWAGGAAPTLSPAANSVDVVTLYTPNGGTTWRGFLSGLAFS